MLMDIAIIGGGPCGTYMAYELSKKHKVTLYEREEELGGCWSSHYDSNGRFSEHAPRVMLDNYLNTINFFSEIGLDFDSEFFKLYNVLYKFVVDMNFSAWDIAALSVAMIFPEAWKGYSTKQLCDVLCVSRSARNTVSDDCYAINGVHYGKCSAVTLLKTYDISIFANVYVSKTNSDKYLIPKLRNALNNVNVKMKHSLEDVNDGVLRFSNGYIAKHEKVILCFPTPGVASYYTGIGVQFHYENEIKMIHPKTETIGKWKIVLSYNRQSKCISTVFLNFKEHELTKSEIISNAWKQITETLRLPMYDSATLSEGTSKVRGKWTSRFGSVYYDANDEVTDYFHTKHYDHVGSHNSTEFPFVSYESAIVNAKRYINKSGLMDEKIKVFHQIGARSIVILVVIVCVIIYLLIKV